MNGSEIFIIFAAAYFMRVKAHREKSSGATCYLGNCSG